MSFQSRDIAFAQVSRHCCCRKVNQLLTEMDGFEGNNGVVVLAATNRADILDQALVRPGRFDRQIQVDPPDVQGRFEILKVHAREKSLAPGVDLSAIARQTPGMSGQGPQCSRSVCCAFPVLSYLSCYLASSRASLLARTNLPSWAPEKGT